MSMSEEKESGFKGGRLIILPTEAFQDYVEHPQVRMMFLFEQQFKVLEGNYTLGNFIYIFKKVVGTSPKEYKNSDYIPFKE